MPGNLIIVLYKMRSVFLIGITFKSTVRGFALCQGLSLIKNNVCDILRTGV